ncbi:MAG: CDP-glycerol glycerophosphotransferase family protein [Myxococcota bacterium]|jgi:CDP-glycerol glycerophosphotransferase (TagB/SpsB family)|nr:CDP-glycerol glycerophosphotransferase family protein [Myxococcota bacterium]
MTKKRILFSGYAKVHFVCFFPVYQQLRNDPEIDIYLSGGFKSTDGDDVSFSVDGFYDDFDVDHSKVLSAAETKNMDFDVLVCAHLSDALFPRSANRTVQIFHGVSFKNLAVREKALRYDYLCLPGQYHAEQYRKQGLIRSDASTALLTGFPKTDLLMALKDQPRQLVENLGLDPALPTLLFAPTGDKHNSLEIMGKAVIDALVGDGRWNLMVKPHDHPKRDTNWFSKLASREGPRMKLLHDFDIAPALASADLLLTDASSVALEYTLLDRPMIFLDTPKLFEKLKKRAPALDLETYGRKLGKIVEGPESIVEAVESSLADPSTEAAIRRQAAEHLFHRPGAASERIAKVVRHAAGLEPSLPEDVERVSTD